mgnify:CR=1 FL=1
MSEIQLACESEGIKDPNLDNLVSDPVKFLKKYGDMYSINWGEIYNVVQVTLLESIIESTLGPYHTRVVRILKMKGYINEQDLQQMCLLPPRDTRAVVNALIKDGFI